MSDQTGYNARITFEKVLAADQNEIRLLKDLLSARGWCFIKFDEDFTKTFTDMIEAAKKFFSLPTETKQRLRYTSNFGYVSVTAKQGVRALTGRRLEEIPIHPAFYLPVARLSRAIDKYSSQLLEVAGAQLFDGNKNYQSELKAKVPLCSTADAHNSRSVYGMLDIVEYYSTKDERAKDCQTAVSEHGDPGLFSFSFKSTTPGLSMLDSITNTWVPVPPDASVMWCGSTAEEISKGGLKVGWHRVDRSFTEPRLTSWYEICSLDQIPESFRTKEIVPNTAEVLEHSTGPFKLQVKTLTSKVIEFEVYSNYTVEKIQCLVEEREGIPPSKQRMIYAGRPLVSERTLGFYNIFEAGHTIHLVLALRG